MNKKQLERSRKVWSNPNMVGKRVHTPCGHGCVVAVRDVALGVCVALERGGCVDFDHTEVTMSDEQY